MHYRLFKKFWKSDRELIFEYKHSGDLASFQELFHRYSHLIYSLCLKYLKNEEDCKDAVMEIFEKSLKAIKKYDIKNFNRWLYSVSKNHCLYKLKKSALHRIRVKKIKNLDTFFMENSDFGNQYSNSNIDLQKLDIAINELKEFQKVCIRLFYLEQKSYREITELTGFTLNQVKSYIQNGKRNLKKLLT